MNEYLRNKLRIISFILMIMVVFLHSYNATSNTGIAIFHNHYTIFIQSFFSHGITRIAVPFFFLISGYLFFLKLNGTKNEFILKYKKRIKSLLLPYIIWSVWGLVLYLILQHIQTSRNFFKNDLITNYSFTDFIDKIFINPIPYQLWFLRDLIVLVIFSPIIYWIVKSFKALPIILLFIVWFVFFEFNFEVLKSESLFFFCFGAYYSITKSECLTKKLNQKSYWIFTCFWLLVVFFKTALMSHHINYPILLLFLHKISILIGVVAIWSMYDIIISRNKIPNKTVLTLSSFSFFLFAFHEPTLTIVKKGLFYITGENELMAMVIYFGAPIITIILSIVLAYFIEKKFSLFYRVITGGR